MKNLAKKMVEVMKECRHVAKKGTNDFHRYKYDTAADVLEMVNDSLTKHGIFTTVETNLLEMRELRQRKATRKFWRVLKPSLRSSTATATKPLQSKVSVQDRTLATSLLPKLKLKP